MFSLDMREKAKINYDKQIDDIVKSSYKERLSKSIRLMHKSFVAEMTQ
jgi:hypothetical protein